MTNLYDSLFEDNDRVNDDFTMDIVNELHGHVDFNCISKYYDIQNYNSLLAHEKRYAEYLAYKFSVIA